MKSLLEYIREQQEEQKTVSSKTFKFNFKDMEGAKEAIESFNSAAGENFNYSSDENSISFTLTKDNFAEASAFITAVKDYIKKLSTNTVKRSSDSQYADRVHKMEDKLNELDNLITDFSTEEKTEEPDEKDKECKDGECKDGECKKDEQE